MLTLTKMIPSEEEKGKKCFKDEEYYILAGLQRTPSVTGAPEVEEREKNQDRVSIEKNNGWKFFDFMGLRRSTNRYIHEAQGT